MESHYTYILIDEKTNEFYIGVRSFLGNPENDRYMGSMKTWKVDKINLKKSIIRTFDDRNSAANSEIELLKMFINDPLNRNYHIPSVGFCNYGRTDIKAYNKLNKKAFIERSNLIHNNKYIYDNVLYIDVKTNVGIICKKHGIFYQKPEKHMVGQGCADCYNDTIRTKKNGDNYFIDEFNKVHNNKYTYNDFIYVSQLNKSIITCKRHGNFLQTAKAHRRGAGCKKCAGEKTCTMNKDVKGFTICKGRKAPYKVLISGKFIGYFDTEEEARQAYLDAKEKYHKI